MADLVAALSRLGKSLEARASELEHVVVARAYIREQGIYLEVKVSDIDRVQIWYAHYLWPFIQDDPERAVDLLLGHFEEKVVKALDREAEGG